MKIVRRKVWMMDEPDSNMRYFQVLQLLKPFYNQMQKLNGIVCKSLNNGQAWH